MPFIEPTSTINCSHTFCKDCISQAVAVTPQCPVDRSALSEADLRPANPIIRHVRRLHAINSTSPLIGCPMQLVDELLVECLQRPFGCSHTCQRQWLATHLKDECQFVKVTCCQEQCEEIVLRKDAGRHSDTCKHRMVQCDACGVRVQFSGLQVCHCRLLSIFQAHNMNSQVTLC